MAKEYIKIGAEDTPEVKAGKEQLNLAFAGLDAETQKSLTPYAERLEKSEGKAKELEQALAEFKAKADADGKSQSEQIEELKTALVDLNKNKVQQETQRRKSMVESIEESLTGEEAQTKAKAFLSNKSAGMNMALKVAGTVGVTTGSVAPQYQPIVGPAHEWVHARNYIPVSPTVSNLIRYVQFTDNISNGVVGPVGPATTKPQFDYTETIVDAPVVKIAGWVNVSDEFLEDIVGSSSFLAADLTGKLYDAEDAEVFKGNNATNHLNGLYTQATALSLPYAGVLSTANNIDKLAAASTYVRRKKRVATAAWTSPEDYLNILINKASGSGEYTYPVRFSMNNQLMIGDIPVIQHTVFNPGEGFVGDFATGARIFQKADASLRFSTENATNFVQNITTVLIEERIALADFYPESFVKVTLNGTYSG